MTVRRFDSVPPQSAQRRLPEHRDELVASEPAPDHFERVPGAAEASDEASPWEDPIRQAKDRGGDEALRALSLLMADDDWPAQGRAEAALAAAWIAFEDGAHRIAECLADLAEEQQPGVKNVERLRLLLFNAQSETDKTLELVDRLLAATPENLQLLRVKATSLLNDANIDEAIAVAKKGYELARSKPKTSDDAKVRTFNDYALALYKGQRPDEAIAVLKESLAINPQSSIAHGRIAEIVLPDLDDVGLRGQIDPLFSAANEAYLSGDYERMKTLALEILALDPNEGLAHKMYVSAGVMADDAGESGRLIIEPLREAPARRALVKKLEEVTGGRPEQLFPEWNQLTELQRATVAHSVLGYAKFIPALMEKGAQFHFVLPGDSLAAADPQVPDIKRKKAFGRYSYSGRGWAWRQKLQVFTGAEKIESAMRGRHNTITHEFAHLAHYHLRDCEKAGEPEHHAQLFRDIETLYAEAKARENGQQLLDAYSGNDMWEYFAQATMAYLAPTDDNKENAPRLFARNPKMWFVVQSLIAEIADYPPEVETPDPPPRGRRDAARPSAVRELAKSASSPHVQTLARGILDRLWLEASAETEGPPRMREERVQQLLARGSELEAIEAGLLPPDQLGELDLLKGLSAEGLMAQVLLLIRGRAARGEEVERLRTLHKALQGNTVEPDAAARAIEQILS